MTYSQTARRFAMAEQSTRSGAAPDPATLAADKLPLSKRYEQARATLGTATIAAAHAVHVEDAAANLREALTDTDPGKGWAMPAAHAELLQNAARALLAAIGEGADV